MNLGSIPAKKKIMQVREVNISLQTGRFQMRFKTKEVNDKKVEKI